MSTGNQKQLKEIAKLIGVLGVGFALGDKTPLTHVHEELEGLLSTLPEDAIDTKFYLKDVTGNADHAGIECTLLYYAAFLNFHPAIDILSKHGADPEADAYFNRSDYDLLLAEVVREANRTGQTVHVTVAELYVNALQGAIKHGSLQFIERWVTLGAPVLEDDIAYAESMGLSKPAQELLLTALTTYMAGEDMAHIGDTGGTYYDGSAEA